MIKVIALLAKQCPALASRYEMPKVCVNKGSLGLFLSSIELKRGNSAPIDLNLLHCDAAHVYRKWSKTVAYPVLELGLG